MTTQIEAWIVHAESPGTAPRSTDDALFLWEWGEAMAVLPGDATPEERATALSVAAQLTHFADGDRSDMLQFRERDSYLSGLAKQDYLDAVHPYLTVSPAHNVRYVEARAGENRGHIAFDVIPAAER